METIGSKVDFLRKKSNLSYSALAEIVTGITGDGMRKCIVRDSVSLIHINTMCEKLGWDRNFILGDLSNSMVQEVALDKYNLKKFKSIPYYDINIMSDKITFNEDGSLKDVNPDDLVFIPNNIDADFLLTYYGNAMAPIISNGDKVAYKMIKDWSFFNYGLKHMIITEEQVLLRYLKKSQTEGNVLLVSENSDFENIELPIKSIKKIYQARYVLKVEM